MRYVSYPTLNKKGDYEIALLIDYGYIFQICIANNEVTDEKTAINILINRLKNLVNNEISGCNGRFIIVGEGKNNFRKAINKDYKKNREKPYLRWGKVYRDFLKKHNVMFTIPTYEADDTIATIHTLTESKYKSGAINYRTCIVSADKDYNQLEGHRYSPAGYNREAKFLYVNKKQADYNFWYQMLIGDSTDNIKGIPQVGKATAKWLLVLVDEKNKKLQNRSKFKGEYTYRDEVYLAYIKKYGNVKEGIKQFELNRQMLQLKTIKELHSDIELNYEFKTFK